MNKKVFLSLSGAFLIVLMALSCKTGKPAAVSAVQVPQHTQAIITFTSGEVFISDSGVEREAEINDFVEAGNNVRVDYDSYCEIQFGNRAVIRIEENTELTIPELDTTAGQSDIAIKLITGSILSKVDKLAGKESFTVQTQSAACGVRGTEFLVRADDNSSTLLAVREGSVVFVPAEINLEELKAAVPEGNKEVLEIISKIETAFTVVSNEQEIEISNLKAERISTSFNALKTAVTNLTGEKVTDSTEISLITDTIIKELESPLPLTDETREVLRDFDTMTIRKIPEPGEGEQLSSSDLLKITVNVMPEDAEIIRNGRIIGKGSFSAILSNSEEITLLIRKNGYIETIYTIKAAEDSDNIHSISLSKDPSYRELSKLTVRAAPAEAEISINGVIEGSGSIEKEVPPEGTYNITVSLKNYQTKAVAVENPEKNHLEEITLLPQIEKRIKASKGSLTGYLAFAEGKIYAADTYGEVIAADTGGAVLWKIQTANTPNERAFPVVHSNRVYFSGANEFITADAATGKTITTEFLDDDSSHVFGRRVVIAGDTGIFPANSRLLLFNIQTGSFAGSIDIPGGTRMTPGVYGKDILIVNQKGVFYRIDPGTGETVYSIPTDALQPVVNNVATSADKAFFNSRNGEIVCINLETRQIVWKKLPGGSKARMITGDIQCSQAGVYAYSENQIFPLSATTGELLFSPVAKISAPPLLVAGRLYYGSTDNMFNVMDAANGKIIESFSIGARVTASPYYYRGKVFAGTDKGEILVLNP